MFFLVQVRLRGEALEVRSWAAYARPGGLARSLTHWLARALPTRSRIPALHVAAIAAGLVVRAVLRPVGEELVRTCVKLDLRAPRIQETVAPQVMHSGAARKR